MLRNLVRQAIKYPRYVIHFLALLPSLGCGDLAVISISESATENASYAELAPLMCAGSTVYGALKAIDYAPGDLCVVQGIGGVRSYSHSSLSCFSHVSR